MQWIANPQNRRFKSDPYFQIICGISLMVEREISNLEVTVRFCYSAPFLLKMISMFIMIEKNAIRYNFNYRSAN